MRERGRLHHLELWLADDGSWAWLLGRLGYTVGSRWDTGCSWVNGDAYIVIESGPDHVRGGHDRMRTGLNHLALWAGSPAEVDAVVAEAAGHGWTLLFPDRHPHAGGPGTYAAYLENAAGFEVELVADAG
nr:VOC family protein [Actinoplanes missouriensis]